MNDFELDSRLKAIPLPPRTAEYWEQFPSSVRRQLYPALAMPARTTLARRLTWSSAGALAGLIFVLALWLTLNVMVEHARAFQGKLVKLPGHLRVLMADEHGLHYLIADQR
jgi:hypothetical protein